MSRGLWFVAGAGAGIYAMVRGRRAAEALTADGLRDRAGAAGLGLRLLGTEIAAGKAEREAELRERMPAAREVAPRRPAATPQAPKAPQAPDTPELDPPTQPAAPARHQMED